MSGTAFEPAPVAVNLPANSRIDARNATGAEEREAYRPSIPDYLYRARGASVSQRHSGELNEACEYDQQTKHGDLPALHLLSPPSTSAGDGGELALGSAIDPKQAFGATWSMSASDPKLTS